MTTQLQDSRDKLVFFLFMCALPGTAQAYVDPGTGAAVTTVILGIIGSITYTFRKYMYRVKDLFTGKGRTPAPEPEDKDIAQ